MGQYDKYICTTLEKRHLLPPPTPEQRDRLAAMGRRIPMEHVHWIDEDVIPGAYYGETTWMWPPEHPESGDVGAVGRGGVLHPEHVPPRPRLSGTPVLVGREPR